jgi:hypothetical protein
MHEPDMRRIYLFDSFLQQFPHIESCRRRVRYRRRQRTSECAPLLSERNVLRRAHYSACELEQSFIGQEPFLQLTCLDAQDSGDLIHQLSTSVGTVRRNPICD